LKQNRPGLLKLLSSNEAEQWIVTEYRPEGTIERAPFRYKGRVAQALKAFRSLVETVASLHKDKIIHRDIKPANVFFGKDDSLVLGDFGIVFLPDLAERLTVTEERVGPRDYMPQWGDLGGRLENVHTNFDVYMLGKLLWCMVAGRLKLPREYYNRPTFDLAHMFPNDQPAMKLINRILDRCVVEDPESCLNSAVQLLGHVDEALATVERPVPMLNPDTAAPQLPCRMCGKGFYQSRQETLHVRNSAGHDTLLRPFVCNVCTHFEFFAPGNPGEAAGRHWRPWTTN
jgi:serine/threonine protein kinase